MNYFTLILLSMFMFYGECKALDFGIYDGIASKTIPFQVSIQLRKPSNQYKHQCLGTIIQEQIILTAAHCFQKNKEPKDVTVVVVADGSILNVNSSENRYKVTEIVKHKHFYPLQGHDIALLKVESPLKLNGQPLETINYNCTEYLKEGLRGYVIGRNHRIVNQDDNHDSHHSTWKLIPHHTIGNEKCLRMKLIYVKTSELCAVAHKSSGPCDGDSGGPLVNADLNIQWALLSYSRTSCKPHRIYVFTRLQPFVQWIHDTMRCILS